MFAAPVREAVPRRTSSCPSVTSFSLFLPSGPALESLKDMVGLGVLSLHVPFLGVTLTTSLPPRSLSFPIWLMGAISEVMAGADHVH